MRPSSLLQRASERNSLPEGTLAVGGGLLVAGVTSYGFLVISARMLGAQADAAFTAGLVSGVADLLGLPPGAIADQLPLSAELIAA